jgi:hypothetical protein
MTHLFFGAEKNVHIVIVKLSLLYSVDKNHTSYGRWTCTIVHNSILFLQAVGTNMRKTILLLANNRRLETIENTSNVSGDIVYKDSVIIKSLRFASKNERRLRRQGKKLKFGNGSSSRVACAVNTHECYCTLHSRKFCCDQFSYLRELAASL